LDLELTRQKHRNESYYLFTTQSSRTSDFLARRVIPPFIAVTFVVSALPVCSVVLIIMIIVATVSTVVAGLVFTAPGWKGLGRRYTHHLIPTESVAECRMSAGFGRHIGIYYIVLFVYILVGTVTVTVIVTVTAVQCAVYIRRRAGSEWLWRRRRRQRDSGNGGIQWCRTVGCWHVACIVIDLQWHRR